MSDINQSIEAGVRNALCWAVPVIQEQAMFTLGQYTRPSVLYRPEIFRDGNAWCALLGPDMQAGVVGFGDSPAQAMEAFDKAWVETPPAQV